MKSRPKNKGKKFVPHQKKRKLSIVSPEVLFAQKLAANDPIQRNRAVKKLQKWLQLRGSLLTKEEIMRIWKGLHYCFWMSDKPLIQEELAETIGHLIHCFPGENALVFIECGLITEGREWVGIDQWRMDKFMMLTRRFLRQAFNFLSKDNWEKVNNMTEIFSSSVISNPTATLGFRLHFTDVYLEEVAKAGGEEFGGDIILRLIEPFAKELAEGDDERLANHIEERIYQHLMRQTEIGVASEEALDGVVEESDEDSNEDEEMEEEEELLAQNEVKDPRAGNVSVSLPQLKADFNQLADHLYKVGSAKGVNSKRRTLLYDLNKQFKDLSQNVYPLIPNLSSENAKIPRIRVGKEAERKSKAEIKFQEKIRMEKEDFKKSLKRKPEDLTEETSELNKKQKTEENGDETIDDTVDDNDDLTEKIHTEDEMLTENGTVTTENGSLSPPNLPVTDVKKKRKKKSKNKNLESTSLTNGTPNSSDSLKADQSVEDIVMEQNETPKKKKIKKIEDTEANELVDYWAARPVSSVSEASPSPLKAKKLKKKKLEKISSESNQLELIESKNEASMSETSPSPLKVKKKKLKKKSAWKISESNQLELNESKNEAIELNTDSEETIKLNRKKKRKAKKLIEMESRNQFCDSLEQSDEVKDIPVMKSKKKKKKNKNTNSSDSVNNTAEEKNILFGASDNDWNPTEAVIKATPSPSGHNFFKKSKSHSAEVKKRKDHISLLDKKKKIVYALSQNRCQSITDMDRSMQDSPDIPFGTEKKPAQGILKTKSANSTPNGLPTSKAALRYNTQMNSKSKAAKKLGLNSRERLMFRF